MNCTISKWITSGRNYSTIFSFISYSLLLLMLCQRGNRLTKTWKLILRWLVDLAIGCARKRRRGVGERWTNACTRSEPLHKLHKCIRMNVVNVDFCSGRRIPQIHATCLSMQKSIEWVLQKLIFCTIGWARPSSFLFELHMRTKCNASFFFIFPSDHTHSFTDPSRLLLLPNIIYIRK